MVIWYGFPKKMHVYCMYFNVYGRYDSVYCMYIARIHVYCMYMTVSMRLTTLRTENTLKYVYTRKYVQYTSHLHTIYDIKYVHHTIIYISRYMHVYVCIYTCMSVNSCCQHVQLLYCPKMTGIPERHEKLWF